MMVYALIIQFRYINQLLQNDAKLKEAPYLHISELYQTKLAQAIQYIIKLTSEFKFFL